MIVLGIDPGAVATGLALIDEAPFATPLLLDSHTIERGPRAEEETGELVDVPDLYLRHVNADAALWAKNRRVEVVGIEGIRRPSWRHAGKVKPVDPSAIMATGIVLGALRAAMHIAQVPVVIVRPLGNGRLFPLNAYPGPLATDGAGRDKRRHERSAYDVAVMAAQEHRRS